MKVKKMANRPYAPALMFAVAALGLTALIGRLEAAKADITVEYDKKFALPPRGECTGELRLAAKPRFAGKALARRL